MNEALERRYERFTLWDLEFNLRWLEQSESEVLKQHTRDLRALIGRRGYDKTN